MQNSNIYSCSFEQDTGILVKTYRGKITLDLMKQTWTQMLHDESIPKHTNGVILDYQNAELLIEIEELELLTNFYKAHLLKIVNCKVAIVSDNPKNIVIPVIIENLIQRGATKPFSTFEAARQWILT